MSKHRIGMIAMLGLMIFGVDLPMVQAQSANFDTSLHATRVGKPWWYDKDNGGFELLTDIPIEDLGCVECHGPTDADGEPEYDPITSHLARTVTRQIRTWCGRTRPML